MTQRRENLRFALKSSEPFRIACKCFGQNFDRDGAVESGIARAIDLAHTSGSKEVDDLKEIQLRSCREGHGCGGLYDDLGDNPGVLTLPSDIPVEKLRLINK